MKILVTGATGFIGNHLIIHLISQGHSVIASSRFTDKAESFPWFPFVKFIPYDFDSPKFEVPLYDFFERPDVLIHLAWKGLPNFNDSVHLEENLLNQFNFIQNYLKSGGKHILITGTCFEYGLQNGCLSETSMTNPITAYAIAKDSLRRFIEYLHTQNYSFVFQWVRLFYMYGSGQHAKSIIPQLEEAIKRGDTMFNMSFGDQIRDYLPIEQVVKNITLIACQDKISGIINCCSGRPVSVKDFVKNYLLERSLSINLNLGFYPYNQYEPMYFWGDNSKFLLIENR